MKWPIYALELREFLHRQQPPLHFEAIRRRVTTQLTTGSEHSMTRHDQRVAILGHHAPNGPSSPGRAACGRELTVRARSAPRYTPACGDDLSAESGQMVERHGRV